MTDRTTTDEEDGLGPCRGFYVCSDDGPGIDELLVVQRVVAFERRPVDDASFAEARKALSRYAKRRKDKIRPILPIEEDGTGRSEPVTVPPTIPPSLPEPTRTVEVPAGVVPVAGVPDRGPASPIAHDSDVSMTAHRTVSTPRRSGDSIARKQDRADRLVAAVGCFIEGARDVVIAIVRDLLAPLVRYSGLLVIVLVALPPRTFGAGHRNSLPHSSRCSLVGAIPQRRPPVIPPAAPARSTGAG